jgi:hypothetical protein
VGGIFVSVEVNRPLPQAVLTCDHRVMTRN